MFTIAKEVVKLNWYFCNSYIGQNDQDFVKSTLRLHKTHNTWSIHFHLRNKLRFGLRRLAMFSILEFAKVGEWPTNSNVRFPFCLNNFFNEVRACCLRRCRSNANSETFCANVRFYDGKFHIFLALLVYVLRLNYTSAICSMFFPHRVWKELLPPNLHKPNIRAEFFSVRD